MICQKLKFKVITIILSAIFALQSLMYFDIQSFNLFSLQYNWNIEINLVNLWVQLKIKCTIVFLSKFLWQIEVLEFATKINKKSFED